MIRETIYILKNKNLSIKYQLDVLCKHLEKISNSKIQVTSWWIYEEDIFVRNPFISQSKYNKTFLTEYKNIHKDILEYFKEICNTYEDKGMLISQIEILVITPKKCISTNEKIVFPEKNLNKLIWDSGEKKKKEKITKKNYILLDKKLEKVDDSLQNRKTDYKIFYDDY